MMASYLSIITPKMPSYTLSSIIVLCSILVLQTNFLSTYAVKLWNMNDTKTYPACLGEQECEKLDGHACFKFLCYPWKPKAIVADKKPKFKGCRRNKDCGGKGSKKTCLRHHDKRNIYQGFCVDDKIRQCDAHTDCNANGKKYGGKCCNGYCCSEAYFNEIKKIPCSTNEGCQDVLTGDSCCYDFTGAIGGWKTGKPSWVKTCCSNPKGPVVEPRKDISEKDLKKIDEQINRMPGNIPKTFCNGLDYEFMTRFTSCLDFTTTPKPTTTTTTTTTTKKPITIKAKEKALKDVNAANSNSLSTTKILLTLISFNLLRFSF